jgi:hypothetical protein
MRYQGIIFSRLGSMEIFIQFLETEEEYNLFWKFHHLFPQCQFTSLNTYPFKERTLKAITNLAELTVTKYMWGVFS